MKSLGICIGASTLKAAVLSSNYNSVELEYSFSKPHESNPHKAFSSLMKELEAFSIDYCVLTGRKFRNAIDLPSITEPEAIESGLQFLQNKALTENNFDVVISLGAENFILYALDKDKHICSVETGNKCASGTGEFFLQQIRRMNLSVSEAVNFATGSIPYRVSGRCSVFCKSDCTHALNKGIPAGRVSAGLCDMIADKILDLLSKTNGKNVLAVGGLTHNSVIIENVRRSIPLFHVPSCADIFEAAGASWHAMANRIPFKKSRNFFISSHSSFRTLPPLCDAFHKVRFESIPESVAEAGDELIIGLDVGSTTTKAVALRVKDNAMVAKTYLRTNGNPVRASRDCYSALISQLPSHMSITGLGTTGSGRQIAGLHAGTSAIINEIIAHAAAAAFFDPEVDTIFEIGGQDAKYTWLTNGVPSDYAMNEACSAGTGSFLEEAARESLGIDYLDIQEIAMQSKLPPDFNDQCAAFISSDIKTASHEGVNKEDIIAGLVYSICINYINRVKGQRPAGKKIFMQGGVCYNRAIPLAMANIIGSSIIVPPEPGLMGAFGVALEVKRRIAGGQIEKKFFALSSLASRDVTYGKQFICKGGTEHCDRKCEINILQIGDKKYPFGGACNRYYNLIYKTKINSHNYDLIKQHQQIIFSTAPANTPKRTAKKIGLNNSFLINTLYPLYVTFFSELGLKVIFPEKIDTNGIKQKRASFCFPAEIAHGAFADLLEKNPDYIFLPSIIELPSHDTTQVRKGHQCTCMLLQSEPYFLKTAFNKIDPIVLSPVLDFSKGYLSQLSVFTSIGKQCKFTASKSQGAFRKAVQVLNSTQQAMKKKGAELLIELQNSPERIAIVLFGRPYNAFASEANLGIPEKFASRGITIIPWDFLPYEEEYSDPDMNWAIGRDLLKAARFTSNHGQLFAVFITNFSCGPDSFLVGYFREIMESKPSLTLELDSHTADAGVNTRIEAFLDIVEKYRSLKRTVKIPDPYSPAYLSFGGKSPHFISSCGTAHSLKDPSVHLLFPSMGNLSSSLMASLFEGTGIHASTLPVYDQEVLKTGRANTSCKECLPLILTTGGLLRYLQNRKSDNEKLIYFMPTCGGNCRFTQYSIFLKKLIERNRLPDIALLSLSNENGYAGLSFSDTIGILQAIIIADCMEDIKNSISVLAQNRDFAMEFFEIQWNKLIQYFRSHRKGDLYSILDNIARELSSIPRRFPIEKARAISLLGEIFVRRDDFSCGELVAKMASRDIIVRRSPILEWLNYCDFNVDNKIFEARFSCKGYLEFRAKTILKRHYEHKIKKIMARSGFYIFDPVDINTTIEYGKHFFDVKFTGESILVAGSFFKDILHSIHGAISIGPFACMPTRITEAVLAPSATNEFREKITGKSSFSNFSTLPFLSIETDGSPFPQLVEARLEAFCLQVERVHAEMGKALKN